MSDVYNKMKVVVSLVDMETDKVIETKDIEVKSGETAVAVELRARKMLMSLLIPEDDFAEIESSFKPRQPKRVTNAELQKKVGDQGDVIQSLIRTLHSRGLMSEAMMKTLAEKLG